MTTNVTPVTRNDAAGRSWRRAAQILLAVMLVVGSVAAQAIDLTPVAIVLLVCGIFTAAPLALPSVDA